jgi:catechol 2,3-dioxygenase-like lactoylglutathione lyase family enzyme
MIGYTLLGTNDIDRARAFYDALFGMSGVSRLMDMPHMTAWGVGWDVPMFGVTLPYDRQAATIGNGSMLALVQPGRAQVDALHAKAIALGGIDEGAPGVRGEEGDQAFYGGYARDLDGNKLCFYHVGPADPA